MIEISNISWLIIPRGEDTKLKTVRLYYFSSRLRRLASKPAPKSKPNPDRRAVLFSSVPVFGRRRLAFSDTDSEIDSEIDFETDSDTDSDTDSMTDSEIGSELGSETDSLTDSETDSEIDKDWLIDSETDSISIGGSGGFTKPGPLE